MGVCGRAVVADKVTARPTPARRSALRRGVRDGFDGATLADVPAASLSDDAPLYDRPRLAPVRAAVAAPATVADGEAAADLRSLLRSPRWVYRQYDHQLFLNTVVGPGGDAALLRLAGPGLPVSERGVAVTTDSNPRACALDPRAGTALILAEGVANLACVGATAVAVVNCLNFGNPEHPEVMWQLSECIDGMAESCRALSLPIIGGNVSFYNESGGADIDPTPVLGVLGLVDVVRAAPPGVGWADGDTIVLLGPRWARSGRGGEGEPFPLEGTRWATERRGHRAGTLPELDLELHATVCAFVAGLVSAVVGGSTEPPLVGAVHDVSSGGLGVTLAEMACGRGGGLPRVGGRAWPSYFSELPSCFDAQHAHATRRVVRPGREPWASPPRDPGSQVGGKDFLVVDGLVDVALAALVEAHDGNLAHALGDIDRPGALWEHYEPRWKEALRESSGSMPPDRAVANLTFDDASSPCSTVARNRPGMAVSDGDTVMVVGDMGLVATVFDERTLSGLQGHLGPSGTRCYSTHETPRTGSPAPSRSTGRWAEPASPSRHNGNLTNTPNWPRRPGMLPGAIATDSDVVAELPAHAFPETGDHKPPALQAVLPIVEGAFSFVLMNAQRLFGVRDPLRLLGWPLCLGRLGPAAAPEGWVLASETPALSVIGATFVREIEPGELVVIDGDGVHSLAVPWLKEVAPRLCIFEFAYIARPDSRLYGREVHADLAAAWVKLLAAQAPVAADMVMGVPESGVPATPRRPSPRASGIPYGQGLVKNRYIGRSFTSPPTSRPRAMPCAASSTALSETIAGKRLVVVDDSIVRGTTQRARWCA